METPFFPLGSLCISPHQVHRLMKPNPPPGPVSPPELGPKRYFRRGPSLMVELSATTPQREFEYILYSLESSVHLPSADKYIHFSFFFPPYHQLPPLTRVMLTVLPPYLP